MKGFNLKEFVRSNVFVIAEIGKNFIDTEEVQSVEVNLEKAKSLVDAAVEAGCDAVKFQTHCVEDEQLDVDITSPHFEGSDRYSWVKRNTEATPFDKFWVPLKKHCDHKGVLFMSTPMSRKAAELLEKLGVDLWKVGSGDVQDFHMLDFLCESDKPIIISSGMVSLKELDEIVRRIYAKNPGIQLCLLYCISKYPAPPEYFNLATLDYFRELYPTTIIGLSDHSLGHELAVCATSIGAQVIEKHFTFSRDMWGSDHKVSMEPVEQAAMYKAIREKQLPDQKVIDKYYGHKNKELDGAKNEFRPYFNRSLVSSTDLAAGASLGSNEIYSMRPRMFIDGLKSEQYDMALGRRLKYSKKKFNPIRMEDLERREVLAVITARGGSKGLPGKNIKIFDGAPLIVHSIRAAKDSQLLTDCIISTDSTEIADVCKEYGGNVPFLRPAELAQDDSKHIDVMLHALQFMEKSTGKRYEAVVVLQPTSPLRTGADIDATLQKMFTLPECTSAVSIVEIQDTHPIKAKLFDGTWLTPYLGVTETEGQRRQNFSAAFKRSSAVYATKRDTLLKLNSLYGPKVAGVVTPWARYSDIDTEEDFMIAEFKLKKLKVF